MFVFWNDGTSLYHYGIKGQHWGERRFQNEDGSLTEEGRRRYGVGIQKLEKKAINKNYKQSRKNGGSFVFKSYRTSTGKNFDEAERKFQSVVANDKKYDELSRKAFDAEKKRLMYEKKYIDDDDAYENLYNNSKEYRKLNEESKKATEAKRARVDELAKQYVDVIKDAKLTDMNVTKNRDIAKQFVSDTFYNWFDDENLDYNIDNFYESWVDKKSYKSNHK